MTISSVPFDNFFIEISVFPLLIAIFILGYFLINVTSGYAIMYNKFEQVLNKKLSCTNL